MNQNATCPACKATDLDICHYDTMMVLSADLALFTLHCPYCGTSITSMRHIPSQLQNEICFAAQEVGAGMGRK